MGDVSWWSVAPFVLFIVLTVCSFLFMGIFSVLQKIHNKSQKQETSQDKAFLPYTRRLGCSEIYMDMHNSVGNLTLVWVTSITSTRQIANVTFMEAFRKLTQTFTMLSVRIKEVDENEKWYEEMSDLDNLDINIKCTNDWEGVVMDQLATNFNSETGPLWRGRVVTLPSYNSNRTTGFNYVVILSFHHGITDGISGTMVCGQYIKVLCALVNGRAVECMGRLALPPALDDLAKEGGIQLKDFQSKIKQKLQPFIQNHTNVFLERNRPLILLNPTIPCKTEVLEFHIPAEKLQIIKRRSKLHGATLHGVFTAVAAQTLAEICQEGALRPSDMIMNIQSAIDVRSRLSPPIAAERMGNLAILMQQRLNVKTSQTVFDLAAACSDQLHAGIHTKDYFTKLRNLPASDFMNFLHHIVRIQKNGGRDDNYFYITNLGEIDKFFPDDADPITVDHVQFREAAQMYGSLFGHHLLTYRGTLYWTLHYYMQIVSDKSAEQYQIAIRDTMLSLAE